MHSIRDYTYVVSKVKGDEPVDCEPLFRLYSSTKMHLSVKDSIGVGRFSDVHKQRLNTMALTYRKGFSSTSSYAIS